MIHNPIRKALPDLSNPGAAGDLRNGKQLVGADGGIITGTLAEVTQATPSISVSSGGLITASATQSGGIVEGGTKSATQQLTTQGTKTVTPGTTNQTAVPAGVYTTGDVDVAGDANLVPENIAEGVSIFGVDGTHSGGGEVTISTNSSAVTTYLVNVDGTYIKSSSAGSTTIPKNSLIVVEMPSMIAPGIYAPAGAAIIQATFSTSTIYRALVQALNDFSITV